MKFCFVLSKVSCFEAYYEQQVSFPRAFSGKSNNNRSSDRNGSKLMSVTTEMSNKELDLLWKKIYREQNEA